jgi:TrbC/VIRB2 pilin
VTGPKCLCFNIIVDVTQVLRYIFLYKTGVGEIIGDTEVNKLKKKIASFYAATMLPLVLTHPAFAATTTSVAGVSNIEDFIKSVITVITSIAGLIAIGFIVVGGLGYITSSGNPEHLDRSKRTLIFAGLGLSISIGVFVLGNIVTTLATNAFGG